MSASDVSFIGSIPEIYDRLLAPMFFAPYAADLARRARALQPSPRRVLEVAAGTGVVTRALAAALPDATLDATDFNETMIAHARTRLAAPNVRWSVADAQALPFEPASFDLVICQFGVMFFPDRMRAFREASRVLRPSGSFLFSVWDGIASNDIARVVSAAAAKVFPQDPPRFVERVPHGHGDPPSIERDLRAAGFADVRTERLVERSPSPSARHAATGVCEGTPLRHEIVQRDPTRLAEVVDTAERDLRAAFGDGPIQASMAAFVFTARTGGPSP